MLKEIIKEIITTELGGDAKSNEESDFAVGRHYIVMTVLGWYKGTLVRETAQTLTITNASWIADTGRFSECVKDDSCTKEEEPFLAETRLIIERSSVIGSFEMAKITRKLK